MALPNQVISPEVDRNFRDLDSRFPVGTTGLLDDSVTTAKIAANAVGASEIGSLPSARVYNSAAITHTSTGANQVLSFDTERFDTDTIHDAGAATRLTATTAGVYQITGQIEWDTNTTGDRSLALRVNGATFIAGNSRAATATATAQMVSSLYKLAATDYVELLAFQNSGANRTINAAANYSPEFMMTWVSDG